MADNLKFNLDFNTADVPKEGIALEIEKMMMQSTVQRRMFERRWYDNNFFDDGFHFRYVSRETGKIIDLIERTNLNVPQRAIPKASRQIRGIANLLMGLDPIPVVYPEPISKHSFPDEQMYQAAMLESQRIAGRVGNWVQNEWKKLKLREQITQMAILSAKHGVSFMQIWPDSVDEKIRTQVFDAFDIYLMGFNNSIYDSAYIIKAVPYLISKLKANEDFDQEQLAKIRPDNRYASSEIKQAYMQSRFSAGMNADSAATLILKEAFIKEYLSDDNWQEVKKKGEKHGVMEGKKKGDMVMRHVFTAGGVWLMDEYVNLPEFPFVDFRYEPGPIYQVPLIERFIPANKSLDTIMSRIERYANTMVTGTYLKRRGEDLQITNIPGGQVLEYTATPPAQMNMVNLPSFLFSFIGQLNNIIEEQGAATSALGQLPAGVRSGTAIESIKATEYANLKIATDRLKDTVTRITERMLDIAARYFVTPQTVYYMDQGKPAYFDIIGQAGIEARNKAKIAVPEGVTPIMGNYLVDIEIESGLGYTMEGKKQTMQQIAQFMVQLAAQGYVSQPAVQKVVERFLKIFQFGSTQEFMEAMQEGNMPMTDQQIQEMKVALAEVLKDTGLGQPNHEQDIQKTKVGVAEALKDLQVIGNDNTQ